GAKSGEGWRCGLTGTGRLASGRLDAVKGIRLPCAHARLDQYEAANGQTESDDVFTVHTAPTKSRPRSQCLDALRTKSRPVSTAVTFPFSSYTRRRVGWPAPSVSKATLLRTPFA